MNTLLARHALRLRALLARPTLARWLAAASALLLLPTAWMGLVIDDFFHRMAARGQFGIPIPAVDLFRFMPRSPAVRHYFEELGFGAWWFPPEAQISYFRPLASLSHVLDYRFIPGAIWFMHLENLAWYAAVVLACGAFYQRFVSTAWVAGLALAFYALDHAHATPVAWIANRNALMALLFGLLALAAHVRAREGPSRRAVFVGLSCLGLLLACFSAESGVAIGGYFVAYAWCLDRGTTRARLLSLAPMALSVVAWRVVYRALGYGIVASGISHDPLLDPGGFLTRAATTWPLFLATDVVGIPADLLTAFPRAVAPCAALSMVLLAALAVALWPLARSRPQVRFLAAGCLLSTVPFGATFPSDRYVFWSGLGIMGLIAELCGRAAREAGGLWSDGERLPSPLAGTTLTRSLAIGCLVMRGLVSPCLFPFRAEGPLVLNDGYERLARSLPTGPEVANQTVVILDSPFDLITVFLSLLRMANGGPVPEHQYLLYTGEAPIQVTRTGSRALEIRAEEGWLPTPLDRTMRSIPFWVGETADFARMHVEVLETLRDGRASAVRFTFPVPLEDPSLVFMTSSHAGLARFAVPAVGAGAWLSKPPLVLDSP